MFVSTKNNVLLQTARAHVSRVEPPGRPQNVRMIFDSCSQRSYAYVVPTICSPISNQSIDLHQRQYNHLQSLKLADTITNPLDLPIDLLIGADYYILLASHWGSCA